MSSRQSRNRLNGIVNVGELNHTIFLSERLCSICFNEDYSDITLVINSERRIPAHKVILAACSEYFRALLFGGLKESTQNVIEMECANPESFEILLRYIYTGRVSLVNMKEELVLELLGLAHQYLFAELETGISDYLRQTLNIKSCCAIYDCARMYNLKYLMAESATFVDRYAKEVIEQESFLQLSSGSMKDLLSRDSFFVPEATVFKTTCRWLEVNGNNDISQNDIDNVLSVVRLPLMTLEELFTVVRPASIIVADKILDVIQRKILPEADANNSEFSYRGLLRPEENVATSKHGAEVLQGEMVSAILDGDNFNYNMETGYTRHTICDSESNTGIVIKLGTQCIVNHMKMLLWDRDLRSYSYYVETSIDQNNWDRVIDYTNYYCRSWQHLYFEKRVVRYVRIVGTLNTANKVFHVVSFEIMYTDKSLTLENGLIVPKHNVCTTQWSASVIEGVSRSRNALIDGKTTGYDWDTGYTCHQLGSGCIIIQLAQPYVVDSMRLLLWDCDDRTYSYFIDVSVNLCDWHLVVDKNNEQCRSWQYLRFERRPVVFIRITGSYNSANEVFHLVHLECPAQLEYNICSLEDKKETDELEEDNERRKIKERRKADN